MKKYFVKIHRYENTLFEYNENDPDFPHIVSLQTAIKHVQKTFAKLSDRVSGFEEITCPNCTRISCLQFFEEKEKMVLGELNFGAVKILLRCKTFGNVHSLCVKGEFTQNFDSLEDIIVEVMKFDLTSTELLRTYALKGYLEKEGADNGRSTPK